MSDRSETLDTPVNKFEPVRDGRNEASGKVDAGHEDALHSELHALSPIGANSIDNLAKGQAKPLDTPPSVPPLTIDGIEPKKAPDVPKDAPPDAPAEGGDASESPLDSFSLEKKTVGQYSIRGQERYLETAAANLTSVKMGADVKTNDDGKTNDGGKSNDGKDHAGETVELEEIVKVVPPHGPVPEDLKAVVGEEREQEFRQAFELMDRFDKAINEEVLKPAINKFTEMLDQAERDMPKEKLDALEAERKNYGLEMKAHNEANEPPPPGSPATFNTLLYHAPPERGKEMKEFDRTVHSITAAVGKEMAENMKSVGEKFNQEGSPLSSADDLVQEYYQRKEDLEPRIEPEPKTIEA